MAALDEKVRAFLEDRHPAVLATINPDGTPQQTQLWYMLDGDDIMMNTVRGRVKDVNLRRDPRASVCVVSDYPSVTVTGHVTLIDDQATAQADADRLAVRFVGE